MKSFLKWVFIIFFVVPVILGHLIKSSVDTTNDDKSDDKLPVSNAKTTVEECNGFEVISQKKPVIYEGFIYKKIGENYEKIINEKATNSSDESYYVSISPGDDVIQECINGDYAWIRVIKPEWLVDTHKGWVKKSILDNGSELENSYDRKVNNKISSVKYSSKEYPVLSQKLGNRFNQLASINYEYAKKLADKNICRYITDVINDKKSTKNNISFTFICSDGNYIDTDEKTINNNLDSIKTREKRAQEEKLQRIKYERISREQVKKYLKDPDSAKFRNQHGFCGEVNAKNSFGGYTGFKRFVVSLDFVIMDDGNPEVERAIDRAWNNKDVCGFNL